MASGLRMDGAYGSWCTSTGPVGEVVAEHEKRTYGLGGLLAGYRRTDPVVPVGAVLVVAEDAEREEQLLAGLVREPLRALIATTNRNMLYRHWPNEQLWRVPGEDEHRSRLIEIAG